MVDEVFNCWLMEVNANPSLNVYNDTASLPNGDAEQTLSEIDKHVKARLITDTLSLLSSAPLYTQKNCRTDGDLQFYKSRTVDEQGCLKLILSHEDAHYEDFYIYSKAEKIFENLAGKKDFITANQFQRLAKFDGMTSTTMAKGHYEQIFKSVLRKSSDTSHMDLNSFFEALEDVARRLYHNKKDTQKNLSDLIANVLV